MWFRGCGACRDGSEGAHKRSADITDKGDGKCMQCRVYCLGNNWGHPTKKKQSKIKRPESPPVCCDVSSLGFFSFFRGLLRRAFCFTRPLPFYVYHNHPSPSPISPQLPYTHKRPTIPATTTTPPSPPSRRTPPPATEVIMDASRTQPPPRAAGRQGWSTGQLLPAARPIVVPSSFPDGWV